LHQYAAALAQQGHQVYWLTSPETWRAGGGDMTLGREVKGDVPPTCRYVVPCQAYRCGEIRVFCVDEAVWQQPALHTRLFTFCCLLQEALAYEVLHAWGALPVAYLAVYTARFLGLPAVVSYDQQTLRADPQQSFLWDWVTRQGSGAVVASVADRERLLAVSTLAPAQVRVIDPTMPGAGDTLTALYESLPRLGGTINWGT
jgi:hypothetical protein